MVRMRIVFLVSSALLFSSSGVSADNKEEEWRTLFLKSLPQDSSKESVETRDYFGNMPIESIYPFAKGVCDSLKDGISKKKILEDSYQFFGVPVSNAMYEAALNVICPFYMAPEAQQEEWKSLFLKALPQDSSKESTEKREFFRGVPVKKLYRFGYGMCDSLKNGMSMKEVLEKDYYPSWGVPVSNAMYKAATNVICPELTSE